jgi:hypothetical protein
LIPLDTINDWAEKQKMVDSFTITETKNAKRRGNEMPLIFVVHAPGRSMNNTE